MITFDFSLLRRTVLTLLLLLPLLVSAQMIRQPLSELKQQLDDPQLIVLDARETDLFQMQHIPGAISFPASQTYREQTVNGQITQPDQMQALMRQRGLDVDSRVVIYDDGGLFDAARLFWALEVYGLTQVRVLEQGFDAWQSQGLPVTDKVEPITPSTYVASINHQRLASKFSTLLATRSQGKLIIDARSESAYQGKESVAKRFGHIPRAINIPSLHNFNRVNNLNRIKPVDELKQIYADVPRDQKVIVYCAIGKASAANYLALRELGLDVANYDASWREWGNDFSLPVVTP